MGNPAQLLEHFERRAGQTASPRGAKAELVRQAIRSQPAAFRLVDIERACPGVGRDWIRSLLADLREFENVPLKQDIDLYFAREVLPHVPDELVGVGTASRADEITASDGKVPEKAARASADDS